LILASRRDPALTVLPSLIPFAGSHSGFPVTAGNTPRTETMCHAERERERETATTTQHPLHTHTLPKEVDRRILLGDNSGGVAIRLWPIRLKCVAEF